MQLLCQNKFIFFYFYFYFYFLCYISVWVYVILCSFFFVLSFLSQCLFFFCYTKHPKRKIAFMQKKKKNKNNKTTQKSHINNKVTHGLKQMEIKKQQKKRIFCVSFFCFVLQMFQNKTHTEQNAIKLFITQV